MRNSTEGRERSPTKSICATVPMMKVTGLGSGNWYWLRSLALMGFMKQPGFSFLPLGNISGGWLQDTVCGAAKQPHQHIIFSGLSGILTLFFRQRGKSHLQTRCMAAKGCQIKSLIIMARSEQGLVYCGHNAQYLYRSSPAMAKRIVSVILYGSTLRTLD